MDVIKAAQEISENGGKLKSLAEQIGNESVESNTKKDLFAYLQRVDLFCHQLNLTSKVILEFVGILQSRESGVHIEI